MSVPENLFEKMVSLEHLFQCWGHFKRGKRKRKEIQVFERHLEDNVFLLQDELQTMKYQHGPYHHFQVCDPKQRHISKASVKDRLVHEMAHAILCEIFDRRFIFHSLSSRVSKGTHLVYYLSSANDQKSELEWEKRLFCVKDGHQALFRYGRSADSQNTSSETYS